MFNELVKRAHENKNWVYVCSWAEANIPPLHKHMETWGPQCGASRGTYLGHVTRMLIDICELEKGLECYQAGSDARKEKDAEIAEQMENHKGRQVAAAIRNQEE